MRTLNYMTEEKQREKAQETLDIYAPFGSQARYIENTHGDGRFYALNILIPTRIMTLSIR